MYHILVQITRSVVSYNTRIGRTRGVSKCETQKDLPCWEGGDAGRDSEKTGDCTDMREGAGQTRDLAARESREELWRPRSSDPSS